MAHVTIELPGMVASLVGVRRIELEAQTLGGAFHVIARDHPRVATHFFDEKGALRQHVLCFHNDTNTRWLASSDVPLLGGDRITFLQAVTGG